MTLQTDSEKRASDIWSEANRAVTARADRLLAILILVEWIAAIAIAQWLTPLAWAGLDSSLHPNVVSAVLLGGIIALPVVCLAFLFPSAVFVRHVVVGAQMLMSALLIHLAGGRTEAHFLVFVSLAFFSFYRDWRVFVTATVVIGADHLLRGALAPESVFGATHPMVWRALEHAAWVAFEDALLVVSSLQSQREMRAAAANLASIEAEMEERSAVAQAAQKMLQAILHTSEQFSEGFAALASRSQSQANGVQKSASGTEEIAATVRQTAANTSQAHGEAKRVEELARQGRASSDALLERMREIGHGSVQIQGFVNVIDELAFQINILALNASIEAAHAGEQGRGFAVVAAEVRALAGRSAQVGRDIHSLVDASSEKATAGVSLARDTSVAITSILENAERVTRILREIAQASTDQSTGVDQIARVLQTLDRGTGENTKLATDSATAAAALLLDANKLAGILNAFADHSSEAAPQARPSLRLAS